MIFWNQANFEASFLNTSEFSNLFLALLSIDRSLLTHSSLNSNESVLALVGEELGNLLANLAIGKLDILLGVTIRSHQLEEAIIGDIEEGVLIALDNGNIHVVGGGGEILQLLASEDIDRDQVNLGVAVLAGLRS